MLVIHDLSAPTCQSSSQKMSSFDSDWSQLETTILHVTDGVYMGYVRLILLIHCELAVGLNLETRVSQIEACSHGVSSNSEQNRVESVRLFTLCIVVSHGDWAALLSSAQARWSRTSDELSMIHGHMLSDQIGHVLIKAAQ